MYTPSVDTGIIIAGILWLIKGQKTMASSIDDLNAEVTAMATSVSAAIAAETAAITAAAAANDTVAIETAVGNLKAVQTTLDTFTATLAPPPPPAPPAV